MEFDCLYVQHRDIFHPHVSHFLSFSPQVLGLTIGLSFTMLVIGAAAYKAWVLFVDMIFILFVPLVIVLFNAVNPRHDNWSDMTLQQKSVANFGTCVTGVLLTCLLGLPLVLLHTHTVRKRWMCGMYRVRITAILLAVLTVAGTNAG